MDQQHREHRRYELHRWRDDGDSIEQATDGGEERRDRQQDSVAENDGTKRKQAKLGAREVVNVELLLVVLRQEVLGRELPKDALTPGNLFHRHEEAEERDPGKEPRECFGRSTLVSCGEREYAPGDQEAPERSPFERLVLLDASVVEIWIASLEPSDCAEESEKD